MTQTRPSLPEPVADRCSAETRYELLSDRGCRNLLTVLAERDGRTDLSELAHVLLDRDGSGYDGDRQTAKIRLYHCDLPKLDAADLVRFDRGEHAVALAESEPVEAR